MFRWLFHPKRSSMLARRLGHMFAHEFNYAPWGNDMWEHSSRHMNHFNITMTHMPTGYAFKLFADDDLATVTDEDGLPRIIPPADARVMADGLRKLRTKYYNHTTTCRTSNRDYEMEQNMTKILQNMQGRLPWQ